MVILAAGAEASARRLLLFEPPLGLPEPARLQLAVLVPLLAAACDRPSVWSTPVAGTRSCPTSMASMASRSLRSATASRGGSKGTRAKLLAGDPLGPEALGPEPLAVPRGLGLELLSESETWPSFTSLVHAFASASRCVRVAFGVGHGSGPPDAAPPAPPGGAPGAPPLPPPGALALDAAGAMARNSRQSEEPPGARWGASGQQDCVRESKMATEGTTKTTPT